MDQHFMMECEINDIHNYCDALEKEVDVLREENASLRAQVKALMMQKTLRIVGHSSQEI